MNTINTFFKGVFICFMIILALGFPSLAFCIAVLYGIGYLCKERPETEAQRLNNLDTERFLKEYEQKTKEAK